MREGAQSFYALSSTLPKPPHGHRPSNSQTVPLGFLWRRRHVTIHYQLTLQPHSHSLDRGMGLKIPTLASPHPEAIQEPRKSPLIRIKDTSVTQEVTRDLVALCQKPRLKNKQQNKRQSWCSDHLGHFKSFRKSMPETRAGKKNTYIHTHTHKIIYYTCNI